MYTYIDNFLNKITMYKLVLWGLMVLSVIALVLSFLMPNSFPESPLHLLESLVLLLIVSHIANSAFSKLFKVQTNVESAYITAIILFFVVTPITGLNDVPTLIAVAVLAQLSKYILALQKKHVFNPVAIALVISGAFGSGVGIWWVGGSGMLIPVAILGFLILRKLQRFEMFGYFAVLGMISTLINAQIHGLYIFETFTQAILSGPLIFFGSIMLTEPLTTPPKRKFQILYAVFIGTLFGAQFSFGPVYSSPELALVLGNILSYLLSPRARLVLTLVEKNEEPGGVLDFVWKIDQKFKFKPGQYLEWTLGHDKPDSRGNRRYFTIASSPTEQHLHLGAKFYPNPSTFKAKLNSLNPGDTIIASQLAGEFTMPEGMEKKLVFIAGGIGVTPFRAMAQYLVDKNERRDIVMLYSNRIANDIAYKNIFDSAEPVGFKTIHVVNELAGGLELSNMRVGMITKEMIMKEIPDYKDRKFYISGPHGMVSAFETILHDLGVHKRHIKTDFFPGFV